MELALQVQADADMLHTWRQRETEVAGTGNDPHGHAVPQHMHMGQPHCHPDLTILGLPPGPLAMGAAQVNDILDAVALRQGRVT